MNENEVRNIISDWPANKYLEISNTNHTISDTEEYTSYIFTNLTADRYLYFPVCKDHPGRSFRVISTHVTYKAICVPNGTDLLNGANSNLNVLCNWYHFINITTDWKATSSIGVGSGYVHPNHSGDVTSVADGAQTIANNAVTLAKLAKQAANTVLANATTGAAVPTAFTMAAQTVLGRLTGGNIDDVVIGIADDNMVQIDSADVADDEYARFTANGLESRSVSEVATDIAGQFTSDIITTADIIATDVYIGNNAAATDPTLNFITSGNDLTITYVQTIKSLNIPSSTSFNSVWDGTYTFHGINPSITGTPGAAAVSVTPNLTAAAGGVANSITAIGGYNILTGTANFAAGSIAIGLSYGNVAGPFVTSGSVNILAIGCDVFGGGGVLGNLTVGDAIGLRASMSSEYLSGTLTATNGYGVYVLDGGAATGTHTVTNQYQIYVEQPTLGTNKYQVVLAGNGTGAGIWLNGTTGFRIYAGTNNIKIPNLMSSGITLNVPTVNQFIDENCSITVGKYYKLKGSVSLTIDSTGFLFIIQ